MSLESNEVVGERLAFGAFELAPAARALWRSGAQLKIGSRALDILIALASRPGEILSKDELAQLVWRGASIDETAVRVGISAARRALGKDAERYIVTVPGRGYCFALGVEATPSKSTLKRAGIEALKTRRLPAQISRIIGRGDIIDALVVEITQRRLVSLFGPGGIGKTTVALAVAAQARGAFDAIAFVDLAPIEDARQMSSGVAAALGLNLQLQLDPVDAIAAAIDGQRVLIVLDSCEHLVDHAAGLVEDLLGQAPGLTILVTTRELLRADGEWVHQLAPLETPPHSPNLSASEARAYAAVEMFEDRAALSLGGYQLEDADTPYVSEICRRLDGIALAIELAASRLSGLGVQGLASSLGESLQVLGHGRRTAPQRHQTLRSTLDWSYRLLSHLEQATLRRLSLFSGDFAVEDACAVLSDSDQITDVGDLLTNLLDKSLVSAKADGRTLYYRMLDTTRGYAQEKLSEAGEANVYRRRHAEHIRSTFEKAQAEWGRRPVGDWLQAYSGQLGNLRAALDWAFSPEGDGAIGAPLTAAAAPLWFHLALLDEGMARVEQAIAWTKDQPDPDRRLMLELHAISTWPPAEAIDVTPSTETARKEALAMAVELGDVDHQLQAVWALYIERANRGAAAESLVQADRFAALAKQARDPQDQLIAKRLRGKSLHFLGDFAGSRREDEQMLDNYEPRPSHLVRFHYDQRLAAQVNLARNLWMQGYADQALALVEPMIAAAKALDHPLTLGAVLCDAACFIALWIGDLELAARYTAMFRAHVPPAYRGWHDLGGAFEGEILIRQGRPEEGVRRLEHALQSLRVAPFVLYAASMEGVLAEGLLLSGRVSDAKDTVEDAIGRCRASGDAWYLAELMRIRALVLAGSSLLTEAADVLADGLRFARAQGALAWELRLASSFVEIEDSARAREVLREVLSRVKEGFGTMDYARAAGMLG